MDANLPTVGENDSGEARRPHISVDDAALLAVVRADPDRWPQTLAILCG